MPRRSAADRMTAPAIRDPDATRLMPSAALSTSVRRMFALIVSSVSPGHLREADRPMVEQLAHAVVVQRELAAALQKQGLLRKGRPNPLIKSVAEQSRLVAALSRTLRLTPQSRMSKERAARTTRPSDTTPALDFSQLRRNRRADA